MKRHASNGSLRLEPCAGLPLLSQQRPLHSCGSSLEGHASGGVIMSTVLEEKLQLLDAVLRSLYEDEIVPRFEERGNYSVAFKLRLCRAGPPGQSRTSPICHQVSEVESPACNWPFPRVPRFRRRER